MPSTMPNPTSDARLELHRIRRGLLVGCEVYLPEKRRFPVRSGVFEREILGRFEHLKEEVRIFVDIGAGEGLFSAYLLRRSAARVLAFEPNPELHGVLLRNLAGNTEDHERFAVFADADPTRIALDALIGTQPGPVLLKIESPAGAIEPILKGAADLLDREDTRVMIRLTGRASEIRCMQILDDFGFSVEIVAPAWWRPLVRDSHHHPESVWMVAEKRPFEILPM